MANSKQNFLGLVKIEGIQSTAYDNLAKAGKLVFAHLWDSVTEGNVKVGEKFIINANGVSQDTIIGIVFYALAVIGARYLIKDLRLNPTNWLIDK